VILDCFAGGGVTLVEGLTVNRRVISVDVNPVASLVQAIQALEVSALEVNELTSSLGDEARSRAGYLFLTECPQCERETDYRWVERAYLVTCPSCSQLTSLAETAKAVSQEGRVVAGRYVCEGCSTKFASVDTPRVASKILRLRVDCGECDFDGYKEPDAKDLGRAQSAVQTELSLVEAGEITVPTAAIPLDWDRQHEDALDRKGFQRFSDLFMPRNRIALGLLLESLRRRKSELPDDLYLAALGQLSALIRYVNSMTFATGSWMDGRPVAWAKHAFWTPNQFIETNPFEYLQHRQRATIMWERDRASRFAGKTPSAHGRDVVEGHADYAVICGDSRSLSLPDECIDAIVTDPPFGGNVQYGELTHLWQVWLAELSPFETAINELDSEILMHRRKRSGAKTADDYARGLEEVFAECHRVLKPEGVLVFTFNNRSADAWYSVMSAAFNAGFSLQVEGVHYQDEIKAYRDTAHLRYDTELQGDVLYTFRKVPLRDCPPATIAPRRWLQDFVLTHTAAGLSQESLAISLHLSVVYLAADSIQRLGDRELAMAWLDLLKVVSQSKRSGEPLLDTCQRVASTE
jgi:adenine-specific DNA methylase